MKNKRGYTIIEFLIVLVITAVLVIIFSVRRQSQIRVAYFREADLLITDIVNKQNLAHMAGNELDFYAIPTTNRAVFRGYEVDARKYLYFNMFEVADVSSYSFVITVYGKDRTPAAGVTYKTKYEDGVLTPILD